jgi:hypothetical protein
MKYPVGMTVYYLEVDSYGRPTRKRSEEHKVGVVVGERDSRGAWVRWKDGFVGSVLSDWIVDTPPRSRGGDTRSGRASGGGSN